MTGEEVKRYIKSRGLTMSDIARETGTTPQNVANKLSRDNVKPDFLEVINRIIDRCCPSLPAEMEKAVYHQAINGDNNNNNIQTVGTDNEAALRKEVEMLRQILADKDSEINFLRKIVQDKN